MHFSLPPRRNELLNKLWLYKVHGVDSLAAVIFEHGDAPVSQFFSQMHLGLVGAPGAKGDDPSREPLADALLRSLIDGGGKAFSPLTVPKAEGGHITDLSELFQRGAAIAGTIGEKTDNLFSPFGQNGRLL